MGKKLERWGPFPQLLEDVRVIEEMQGVQAAGVQEQYATAFGSGAHKRTLVVNVRWVGRSSGEESFANDVAKAILQHDAKVPDHDSLRIIIIRGYDLGIAHAQVTQAFEHSPQEWNMRLFGNGQRTGTDSNRI